MGKLRAVFILKRGFHPCAVDGKNLEEKAVSCLAFTKKIKREKKR